MSIKISKLSYASNLSNDHSFESYHLTHTNLFRYGKEWSTESPLFSSEMFGSYSDADSELAIIADGVFTDIELKTCGDEGCNDRYHFIADDFSCPCVFHNSSPVCSPKLCDTRFKVMNASSTVSTVIS